MKRSSKKTKNNKIVNFIRKIYYDNELIFLILLKNKIIITIYILFFVFFVSSSSYKKKIVENFNLGKIEKIIKKIDTASDKSGKSADNFISLISK